MSRKDVKNRVLKNGETQRPNGTYMYRYKDYYGERKSVYAKTLDELRKKEEVIANRKYNRVRDTDATLNQMFDLYISLRTDLNETLRTKYIGEYARWVAKERIGSMRVTDIRHSDVVAFYNKLYERLSGGTVRHIAMFVYGALETALNDDYILKNPATNCLRKKLERKKVEALSEQDVEMFFKACDNAPGYNSYKNGLRLMYLTGMRYCEAVALTWNDVDFENRVVYVNRHIVRGKGTNINAMSIKDGAKTKSGVRGIPMSQEAYDFFVGIKKEFADSKIIKFSGVSDFVIRSETGKINTNMSYNFYCKKIMDFCLKEYGYKLPNVSCHVMRHTFCSMLARKNISQEALKRIMGHSSYIVTSDVYITLDDDYVAKEFRKIMG